MKIVNEHKIDLVKIAEGLNITLESLKDFLDDGRVLGRLGEFIEKERLKIEREPENSIFDLNDKGEKIEIRSITKQVSFAQSKEIGYGRKVTEEGFRNKLNNLDCFILIDKRNLSELKFIKVTKKDIYYLIDNNHLNKNKSISSKKFYEIFERGL
jgi:hypothetical protein